MANANSSQSATSAAMTAEANQLLAAELSPQELDFTVEAIKQVLPMHEDDGDPQKQLQGTLTEALELTAGGIRQDNNKGLVKWLKEQAAPVTSQADIKNFVAHIQSMVPVYSELVKAHIAATDSKK